MAKWHVAHTEDKESEDTELLGKKIFITATATEWDPH